MSIIKKIRAVIMYVLLLFLILSIAAFSIINTPSIQTYLAKKLTTYLSKELKTEVKIDKIEIEFLKTAVLHGLLINDLHHDTLIYAKKAKLDYFGFFKETNIVQFNSIQVEDGRLKIRQYKNEDNLNIDFFVDFVSPPSKVVHPKNYIYQTIALKKLKLKNFFFTYRYEADTSKTTLFNSSDISFKNIDADVENFKILRDTVSFYSNNFKAIEKCGLEIKELKSYIRVSPVFVELNDFKLSTGNSKLFGTYHIKTKSYRDYNNFENLVYMDGKFKHSIFSLKDAAFFNQEVIGLNLVLKLDGEIKGTESSIKGKNLSINFGKSSSFKGSVSMKGLPNWQNTYTYLKVDELITNKNDIEEIESYPFINGEKIKLPKEFDKLGTFKIYGNFAGFESDFVSNARISTGIGDLETDIEMKTNNLDKMAYYKGILKAKNFHLGKYYELSDYVGKLSLNVSLNGHGLMKENVDVKITGDVKDFQFNNYTYKNISVDGIFTKDIFNGIFNINDENANLDFNGIINLKESLPSYKFASKINYANLNKLGITSNTNDAIISTQLKVDIKGDNIDNLIGQIEAKNTIYIQTNKAYKINNIELESSLINSNKKLTIRSDFANANITGKYSLLKIGSAFKRLITTYIPTLESNKKVIESLHDKSNYEHFTFDVSFLNSQPLTKSFLNKIEILPGTIVSGHFFSEINDFSLKCTAHEIKILNTPFKNFNLEAKPINDAYSLNFSAQKIALSDSAYIESFEQKNYLKNDTLISNIHWLNNGAVKNAADLNLRSSFNRNSATIKILPSILFVQDSLISIDPENKVRIDSSGFSFYKMNLFHNQQSVSLNSNYSQGGNELSFVFKNFTMSWLNSLFKSSDVNLNGNLNGQGMLGFSNHNLIFTTTISISDFKINDDNFGDGSLICVYNDEKESIAINGKFILGEFPVASARGFYFPYKEEDNLDLEISFDNFKLKYAEVYTKGLFSNLKGYISGDLILNGSINEPILQGALELQKSSFKVDYLNTQYSFNGKANFLKNKIVFDNVILNDIKGNKAIVSGSFSHDYFNNIKYKINIEANKLMCLNTNATQNEMFYGKAFASGNTSIVGDLNNVNFDINAKSEKGTTFVIPLYGAEEIAENSFIEFVNKNDSKKYLAKNVDLDGIEMKFDLELTPDAEIQMIFDPKIGDAIYGTGLGNIKMDIDKKGDFTMFGNYNIIKGNYLFTLQNFINRNFKLEQGGLIQWTGDPFNADININAIYSLKTPLHDIYPVDKSNIRVPVECKLMMTDKLMKPTIKFDINLPTSDQTTRDAVRNTINAGNEAELNKQVFSLLVLGTFFPSETANTAESLAKNNVSELLSNQMSNWLGQTFKSVNLNLKYNSASDSSNREIAIAASKQLFNNKMSIDGTFGYSSNGNVQNPTNIIGDVNIDYKITNDGRFHLRAYNRSNDYSQLLNPSPYTQGFVVYYKDDFNYFTELLKRKKRKQLIGIDKENVPN